MSSVNFGNEAMAASMNKRVVEEQGRVALSLIQGAAQTASVAQAQANAPSQAQVQAPQPVLASDGSVGRNINTYA